jgi:NAD(P)-dependent dehydrogenase (short-subunit alcohol dehydrogenase family)
MGAVTAESLARAGAEVTVIGRDVDKGTACMSGISQRTGNLTVEFLAADLSSLDEVRRVADEFRRRHARLDVLVNNAGVTFARRRVTTDGLEMTFAVNYLSAFLLTNLVMDLLEASAPSRIVNVSSRRHAAAMLDLDDLQNARRYSGIGAYGQSKLCLLLFTYEMARRLETTGVTVNAMHPGFVRTGFGERGNGLMSLVLRVAHRFAATPAKGAQTIIYLASSAAVNGVTGKYFYQERAIASSPESYETDAARRLWEVSCNLSGISSSPASG